MRFLVDNFGEEFKYEDPRISDDYIDKNNIHGQYEIVLDDDGESPAVIAIWKNEENEMKSRFDEKKKLFKEGPGAAYTVTIKDAKLGNVRAEKNGDGDWEFEADIVPDVYQIEASDYYNLFCPMDYDDGGEEWAEVKGKVKGVCWWYDEDYEVEKQISGTKQDLSFMYGHGWIHANLPEDGHIMSDHMECDGHDTWEIQSIELESPELADCVNYCHEHFLDEDEDEEEEEEDGEQVNEVSGWDLEDEDLTLVNSESDGDKLYIVKLWWGSGYQLDCYNAYAFNEEEALNYVVAYIEKEDPGILEMSDEAADTLRTELADENGLENSLEAEDLPEFQETFMYVDATMEGASDTHYIWAENLQIAEYPKEHDYPQAKGARRMDESYDEGWASVGAAFNEFTQRLWSYTRKDRDNRIDAFQKCTKTCEQAMRDYFNEVVL